jgi:hypothetical protein
VELEQRHRDSLDGYVDVASFDDALSALEHVRHAMRVTPYRNFGNWCVIDEQGRLLADLEDVLEIERDQPPLATSRQPGGRRSRRPERAIATAQGPAHLGTALEHTVGLELP